MKLLLTFYLLDVCLISFIMYIGLLFVSRYSLDTYCPNIPIKTSSIPRENNINNINIVSSETYTWIVSALMINTTAHIKIIKQINRPKNNEKINGVVENAVIPSIAYLHKFLKVHLVFPLNRFSTVYGI